LGDGAGLLEDNLTWTAGLSVIDFLRDVGKHFPVNGMLARESVSARLAGGGLSYTEFSYQLLQALDYAELWRRHGCRLQLGGSDQWGNITAGLDYLRRVEGVSAHALTFPLITDASGAKLGKSTGGGSVWL
ncbi:tyrosine--tRNA ligase, partial [Escherichia coli]|nr:tyrosine--tRNA ligase [Escherichia coli]